MSEGLQAQPNDPLFLDITLEKFKPGDPVPFCRAIVKADGIALSFSPVNVPHIGGGSFFKKDPAIIKFPENRFEVSILYEFFNEAGFLTKSNKHGNEGKDYRLGKAPLNTNPDLIKRLDTILSLIAGLTAIEGFVDTTPIVGELEPVNGIEGNIPEIEKIAGEVSLDKEVEGKVDSSDIDGTLE